MRALPYTAAIFWIAENGSAGIDESAEQIAEYPTTHLVSNLYGKSCVVVTQDIVKCREKLKKFDEDTSV